MVKHCAQLLGCVLQVNESRNLTGKGGKGAQERSFDQDRRRGSSERGTGSYDKVAAAASASAAADVAPSNWICSKVSLFSLPHVCPPLTLQESHCTMLDFKQQCSGDNYFQRVECYRCYAPGGTRCIYMNSESDRYGNRSAYRSRASEHVRTRVPLCVLHSF